MSREAVARARGALCLTAGRCLTRSGMRLCVFTRGATSPSVTSSLVSRRPSSRSLRRARRLSASLSNSTSAMAATIFKWPSAAPEMRPPRSGRVARTPQGVSRAAAARGRASTVPCISPSAWRSDCRALMVLTLKSPTRRNSTGQPASPVKVVI